MNFFRLLKITRKVERFSELISYFSTREWKFSNNNTQQLWSNLDPRDQEMFPFTFAGHDWESYFKTYMCGARQYLLKDDPSTIPVALARRRRSVYKNHSFKFYFKVYAIPISSNCFVEWNCMEYSNVIQRITSIKNVLYKPLYAKILVYIRFTV